MRDHTYVELMEAGCAIADGDMPATCLLVPIGKPYKFMALFSWACIVVAFPFSS